MLQTMPVSQGLLVFFIHAAECPLRLCTLQGCFGACLRCLAPCELTHNPLLVDLANLVHDAVFPCCRTCHYVVLLDVYGSMQMPGIIKLPGCSEFVEASNACICFHAQVIAASVTTNEGSQLKSQIQTLKVRFEPFNYCHHCGQQTLSWPPGIAVVYVTDVLQAWEMSVMPRFLFLHIDRCSCIVLGHICKAPLFPKLLCLTVTKLPHMHQPPAELHNNLIVMFDTAADPAPSV
jgi:hypothetical protein